MFGSCDAAIHRALEKLLEHARAREANRVQNVQFRARSRWVGDPVCRRNLNYAWLVIPALFPIPTSVTVRGEAVFDPGLVAVSGSVGTSESTPGNRVQGEYGLCSAMWPPGPSRADCVRNQVTAFRRLEPAIERMRRRPDTREGQELRRCYGGAQHSQGTDWVAVERCTNLVPASQGR